MPEVFNTNRAKCINSIINGVYNALYGGEFDIDNSIAEMTEYNKPIKADCISDNDNNQLNCNKHMNKNTIRLSESQLHNVIKESVKQVISELDWKTYASAAKKRRKQYLDGLEKDSIFRYLSGPEKDLEDAAAGAFLRDHPGNYDMYNINGLEKGNWGTNPHLTDYYDMEEPKVTYQKRKGGKTYTATGDEALDIAFKNNPEGKKSFKDASKEMKDFHRGNYEYEKGGRGWHLKDGIDESIRKAIGKVINEAKAKQQFILKTDDDRYVIQSPIGNFLTLSTEYAHPYHKKAAEKIVALFAQNGIKVTPIEYLGKYNKETGNFDLD